MRPFLTAAFAATLAFSAAPHAARAAEPVSSGFAARTVGDLANLCAGSTEHKVAAENFCFGYAQGVLALTLDQAPKPFCLPEHPPTRAATMAEFVTWARAKDSRLSGPAAKGLVAFFSERFPCSK